MNLPRRWRLTEWANPEHDFLQSRRRSCSRFLTQRREHVDKFGSGHVKLKFDWLTNRITKCNTRSECLPIKYNVLSLSLGLYICKGFLDISHFLCLPVVHTVHGPVLPWQFFSLFIFFLGLQLPEVFTKSRNQFWPSSWCTDGCLFSHPGQWFW